MTFEPLIAWRACSCTCWPIALNARHSRCGKCGDFPNEPCDNIDGKAHPIS